MKIRRRKYEEALIDHFGRRLLENLLLIKQGRRPEISSPVRLAKWANEVSRIAFVFHPELRPEGSFERAMVAKRGRKAGLRGNRLSEFIEEEMRVA